MRSEHGLKMCYVDTETTGTDPDRHGIIQVAMIVEIGGKVEAEKEWLVRPHNDVEIDDRALEVNRRTRQEIQGSTFAPPDETFREIEEFLGQFVGKFNRADKLTPAGHNVGFDCNMLKSFWKRCGSDYYGSWFNWDAVDSLALLRYLKAFGLLPPLKNLKLATVCEHFGIKLGEDAHDALADIKATRELVLFLAAKYLNRGV